MTTEAEPAVVPWTSARVRIERFCGYAERDDRSRRQHFGESLFEFSS
jgi:hypothetical protein